MEWFYIDKSPVSGKYFIYNHLDFPLKHGGSYSIFCARMLGLSFAQYLRMCRDIFNGELVGKEGYTKVYFENERDAKPLVELLNKTYNLIKLEQEIVRKQKAVLGGKNDE